MHFIYLSLEIFTLGVLYCCSPVYCKPLPHPSKIIHLLPPASSRVRYKRQLQGFGILNPMFHNTEYLPYPDMGNVHFWGDGWLIPPNVYASDLGPFEFYPVGTWVDFLPGLSDSPAVLGGRGVLFG